MTVESVPRLSVRLAHPLFGEVRRPAYGSASIATLTRGPGCCDVARGQWPRRRIGTAGRVAPRVDAAPDPDLLRRAAAQAAALLDPPLVLRLSRACMDIRPEFDVQSKVVGASTLLSSPAEIERELELLTELATSDFERAHAAELRANFLARMIGEPERAAAAVRAAARTVTELQAVTRLAALSATLDANTGNPRSAVATAANLFHDDRLNHEVTILVCMALASASAVDGRADRLTEIIAKVRTLVDVNPISLDIYLTPLIAFEAIGSRLAGWVRNGNSIALLSDQSRRSAIGPATSDLLEGMTALAHGRPTRATQLLCNTLWCSARSASSAVGGTAR